MNNEKAMNSAISLMQDDGIPWTDVQQAQIDHYVQLLLEWNAFASLISTRDESELVSLHLPDCFSLVSIVKRAWEGTTAHLDIGSGGGLPAIPIKIALPALPMSLIERNAKKVGFLRKVIGALGLQGVSILHGEFPAIAPPSVPGTITARAVEKPLGLGKPILALVGRGAEFLCQSRLSEGISRSLYDVAPVDDLWKTQGLRRGELWIVQRRNLAAGR